MSNMALQLNAANISMAATNTLRLAVYVPDMALQLNAANIPMAATNKLRLPVYVSDMGLQLNGVHMANVLNTVRKRFVLVKTQGFASAVELHKSKERKMIH